jgi:ATP-binding cassette, subfamily B, bacterial
MTQAGTTAVAPGHPTDRSTWSLARPLRRRRPGNDEDWGLATRPARSDIVLCRRLLRETRPYWPHLAGTFFVSLLSTPLMLLMPLPLTIAVDSVVGTEPLPDFLTAALPENMQASAVGVLLILAVLYLLIALLNQLQQMGTYFLHAYVGEKLVLAFRTKLFHQAQRLSLAYHDAKGTADAIYRIQWDAPYIQYLTLDGAIPLLTASIMLAGMIVVTAWINWKLALVALTISPLVLVISQLCLRRLREQGREVKELESSALSVVQEVLGALRVVKAFGREDHEEGRFRQCAAEGVWARIRLSFAEGLFGFLIRMCLASGTAIVLFVGVRQVRSGEITLGALFLVMSYLLQLYEPLRSMSEIVGRLQFHLASAERAFEFLEQAPDVSELPDARGLERAKGTVSFRDVSFTYPGKRAVLKQTSFEVSPANRVGIIGATGAGKTTLVSLLMRFYDPAVGQILLDGIDLRNYKLADLRRQFAIVLQEPVLFSTTVAENIAYARPGATREEIAWAAKSANIHEVIASLPDGYDTLVGERGMRVSGGERQRISLARAFLKDAPVLILDEPTSAVDAETETAILEAMERLTEGRTTFIIAHRLSTLKHCDVLFRIERGELCEVTSYKN